ncbi:MAG: hypothetical protein IJ153_03310 [Clostridia bacterium]|nr:hypothetical protein [Clostridia bacterium]
MRNKNTQASPFRWMLKRYFFLFVVVTVICFALFPMQGMMRILSTSQTLSRMTEPMEQVQREYYTRQLSQDFIYSPLNLEVLCLLFGGMGYVAAMVLFRHLFSRKQGMMIASLPMTRGKSFLLRLGVYGVWCVAPMVLCMAINPLAVWVKGLGEYFSLTAYLRRAGLSLLINLYGFALGTLSATLFGTIWSAALGSLLMAGSVEVALMIWIRFAATYLHSLFVDQAIRSMLVFSPIYSLYKSFYQPGDYGPWPGLVAAVIFLALAFLAYRKGRPEHAGHTLIQKKLEPLLVAWAAVLGGTAGALALVLYLGREIILYLGLILGALALSLLARMLLDQRIGLHWKQWKIPAAATLVMILALLGLRMDITGFDRYAPTADQLARVRVWPGHESQREMRFEDPESLEATLGWIGQMRQELLADKEKYPFQQSLHRSVEVIFEDQQGREVHRQYMYPVDQEAVLPELRIMAEKYSQQRSEEIPQVGNAYCYGSIPTYGLDTQEFMATFGFFRSNDRFSYLNVKEVREALRQDLQARTFDTLQEPTLLNLYMEGMDEETGTYRYDYSGYNVTAGDQHLLDLILGEEKEKWLDYVRGGFAKSENLRVFLCEFEEKDTKWELKSYQMAEDENQVLEWMSHVDRCEEEIFYRPRDRRYQVRVYSLSNLQDQVGYGTLELDLEDPEVISHLPEYDNVWGSTYTYVKE